MAVCASGGQVNPEIARFCLACGVSLGGAAAPPREERRLVSVAHHRWLLGKVT